ncbi:hypothetical protein GUITHDRAFT_107782 [Guillardia theta CCMP2712]|uniref:Uncharacterized protein n=1 Tax=Guillardia theta (strain CCMP2712) TaxID=905079 RepID=L1JE31_GUITC|nr:hypothetical protein GUITHDRAFT_107782 [Guillardia theta CCMP2712]EKX46577.1 hypothetical protein GUITHDRAFT_107782 [Guillardia theta CCMP2712]|eukprot:XP_005833557.1 hypothetical protein GUITHDRAFT_107782 [Guillardia theta CCMP2712]
MQRLQGIHEKFLLRSPRVTTKRTSLKVAVTPQDMKKACLLPAKMTHLDINLHIAGPVKQATLEDMIERVSHKNAHRKFPGALAFFASIGSDVPNLNGSLTVAGNSMQEKLSAEVQPCSASQAGAMQVHQTADHVADRTLANKAPRPQSASAEGKKENRGREGCSIMTIGRALPRHTMSSKRLVNESSRRHRSASRASGRSSESPEGAGDDSPGTLGQSIHRSTTIGQGSSSKRVASAAEPVPRPKSEMSYFRRDPEESKMTRRWLELLHADYSFHHPNRPNDGIRRRELKYSVFNFSDKSIATPELEKSDSFKNLLINTLDVNDSSSSTNTAAATEINALLHPPSPLFPSSSKGKIPVFGSEQQGKDQDALSPMAARHEEGEGLVSDHTFREKKEVLVKTAKQTRADGRLAMKKQILLSSPTSSFDPVINLHDIPPHAQDSNMRWDDPSHVLLFNTGISVNVKMSDKQVIQPELGKVGKLNRRETKLMATRRNAEERMASNTSLPPKLRPLLLLSTADDYFRSSTPNSRTYIARHPMSP